MKHKIPIFITITLLLALSISATAMTALAARDDHSNPNSTAERVTLDSADIVELVLGIELSSSERDYLALYGGESITYSDMIPSSYVITAYDADDGTLAVYARVYEYFAADGIKKSWTPKMATVGEISVPLRLESDDKYVAELKNVTEDTAATLDVIYSMSITISAKKLNSLMNKAFVDAPKWDAYAAYLKAKEEYYEAQAAYEAYLIEERIYNSKRAEYEKYLAELAEYEADLLAYTEYEAALDKYNSDYNKYLAYLDAVKDYDKNVALYEEYLLRLETANYHISILDGTIALHTSKQRSIRNAIMGDTVTRVLENRDAIANDLTKIPSESIDNAGHCTDYLREFYTEYESMSGAQEKYAYYAMNYEKIRDSFVGLFQSLDFLYMSGKVRLALESQGLKEKYEILLAELYYLALAISDVPVSNYEGTAYYNDAYKINEKSPLSILEGTPYIKDLGDAKPLEGGYPTEVKKPDQLAEEIKEPAKPTAVLRPVAPAAVANPGEAPVAVALPSSPGVAPAIPVDLGADNVIPDEVITLIAAYKAGVLSERSEVAEGKSITLEAKATKKIFNTDEIAINFHDHAGVLLDTVNVERGSYVEFAGNLPVKTEDEVASYAFSGWQDHEGKAVDMRAVNCDGTTLDLYPIFDTVYKLYDVTWIIDGKKTVTKERYGVMPEVPFTPTKGDTGSFLYRFLGWNRELAPVSAVETENVYAATFETGFIVPYSNGSGAKITLDGTDYLVDATSSPENSFDLSALIQRAAGKGAITIHAGGYTVKFSYTEVIAMSELGVQTVSVYSVSRGMQGYSFYVDLFDANGEKANEGIKVAVSMPYVLGDPSYARLFSFDKDVRSYVKATVTDTSLSATVSCGVIYYASLCYAVDVLANDTVGVSVSDASLPAGSKGVIKVDVPDGVEILSYYMIKGNGERVELDGPEFTMPKDSVSVGVVCSYFQYTVKFVSAGTVISIATYKYGEMPIPPADPKRATDERYSYEFIGWDSQIGSVTADTVYYALYKSTPVPVVQKPDGPQISDGVIKIISKAVLLGGYGCIVVLPIFTVVVVGAIRRVRWIKPRKKH